MFDGISKRLRKFFFTDALIDRILTLLLHRHLKQNYFIASVEDIPDDFVEDQRNSQNMEDFDERPAAITIACPNVCADGTAGIIIFGINALREGFGDSGVLDALRILKEVVLHESRHADQFEFLRARGGSELIDRVFDDQRDVPYFENILELDAYHYQFTGEAIDLELVFEKYL